MQYEFRLYSYIHTLEMIKVKKVNKVSKVTV